MKDNILKAAIQILEKEGVEKVSMRNIGKILDCAAGLIYYYYKDKEAILKDVYAQTCSQFLMGMKKMKWDAEHPERSFERLVVFMCLFRIRNSYRYREVFVRLGYGKKPPKELLEVRAYFVERLSQLHLARLHTEKDLEEAGRVILAYVEGIASISSHDSEKKIEKLTLEGIRPFIHYWR